jgi:hypothetical protein
MGHRWWWELTPLSEDLTRVTETFNYSQVGSARAIALELSKMPRQNTAGIEATLRRLQARYRST